MQFFIEQLALAPHDPIRAKQLLTEMGAVTWAEDHVIASGRVDGHPADNEADLSFNYDLAPTKPLELEVLHYTSGANWVHHTGIGNSVSHLGCHCTPDALRAWIRFFEHRGIGMIQSVVTRSHTNPVIAGTRTYEYVIFHTRPILGVDLKFIVRRGAA